MEWINLRGRDSKYLAPQEALFEPLDAHWTKEVNAPRLLSDLFSDLSEARVEYRKMVHSIQLTDWLLENQPEAFTELVEYLEPLISQESARVTPPRP